MFFINNNDININYCRKINKFWDKGDTICQNKIPKKKP